jgi:hypothetical protein
MTSDSFSKTKGQGTLGTFAGVFTPSVLTILGINLRAAFLQGCNIILLDAKPDKWQALDKTSAQDLGIDVWWWADATSRLMLLLAYLMTRSEKWRHAKIRLLAVADGDKSRPTMESLQEEI